MDDKIPVVSYTGGLRRILGEAEVTTDKSGNTIVTAHILPGKMDERVLSTVYFGFQTRSES